MQGRDVRVPDECFRIALEDLRLEERDHAHRAVTSGAADDRLHAGIQPDPHEILGATFVLGAREATQRRDLRIEKNRVPRALERLDAARQPADTRRIRWCNNADGVALGDRRGTQQRFARTQQRFGRNRGNQRRGRSCCRGVGKNQLVGGIGGHRAGNVTVKEGGERAHGSER